MSGALLPRWAVRHAASGEAVGVHWSGELAALGSDQGICVLDLSWPWEFSRVLQQPDAIVRP